MVKTSPEAESLSEGNLSEDPPSYYHLNGNNGLRLRISKPNKLKRYDYTIMFWMRSHLSHEELAKKYLKQTRVLFDTKTFSCDISIASQRKVWLSCSPDYKGFKINIARFADI